MSQPDEVWHGARSALIRSRGAESDSDLRVNALWQAVDATRYRGTPLELSVHVKSHGGVFLFLQGVAQREVPSESRGLRIAASTNRYFPTIAAGGWTKLEIVADVPADAVVVYFGVAHNGSAPLWIDDVHLIAVAADTARTVTASQNAPLFLPESSGSALSTPTNLDFEATGLGAGAPSGSRTAC